jgi:hypothetical protein
MSYAHRNSTNGIVGRQAARAKNQTNKRNCQYISRNAYHIMFFVCNRGYSTHTHIILCVVAVCVDNYLGTQFAVRFSRNAVMPSTPSAERLWSASRSAVSRMTSSLMGLPATASISNLLAATPVGELPSTAVLISCALACCTHAYGRGMPPSK